MHDILFSPTNERLLATRMYDKEAKREIIVASFHASPLTAPNSLRRVQIEAAHMALGRIGEALPTVMVGDYNYPLFTGKLMRQVVKSGYDMTLSDRRTYLRYKIFRGHFDFVTSTGVSIEKVETLPQGVSDHLPIMITAHVERNSPNDRRGSNDERPRVIGAVLFVREGGLEPPRPIRALAPQASASAISAIRAQLALCGKSTEVRE